MKTEPCDKDREKIDDNKMVEQIEVQPDIMKDFHTTDPRESEDMNPVAVYIKVERDVDLGIDESPVYKPNFDTVVKSLPSCSFSAGHFAQGVKADPLAGGGSDNDEAQGARAGKSLAEKLSPCSEDSHTNVTHDHRAEETFEMVTAVKIEPQDELDIASETVDEPKTTEVIPEKKFNLRRRKKKPIKIQSDDEGEMDDDLFKVEKKRVQGKKDRGWASKSANYKRHDLSALAQLHVETTTYECSTCCRKFNLLSSLQNHIKTHSERDPYRCEVCHKKFTRRATLNIHMRSHSGALFECNICSKKYSTNYNLKLHINIHTGNRPCICEICGKNFNFKSKLIAHMRTHTGEKPYKCDVCNSDFELKGEYQAHLSIHAEKIPFKCQVCKKQYSDEKELSTHMSVHANNNNYTCHVCNKCYTSRKSLRNHLVSHTEVKPFNCMLCNKTFMRKATLNIHLRRHTGVKPFRCEVCAKEFVFKDGLDKHFTRLHAEEKLYKCDACSKEFALMYDLKRHIKSHAEKNL